jgi:choline monooxygenase
MASDIAAVLDELRAAAAREVTRAASLPPPVYTSANFHALERAGIFHRDWLAVCRAEDVPDAGDYVTCDMADLSFFALRGRDGNIRCFANTCRHRMSRLLSGAGNCGGKIVCPYHAWTYRDDGRLVGVAHMEKSEGFQLADHRLAELHTEVWGGFVFATMNKAIAPVAERLSGIANVTERFGMAGYRKVLREDFETQANWKLIQENFMETYHLPHVHRTTLGTQEPVGIARGFEATDAYSIQLTEKYDDSPRGHAHPANTVLTDEWRRTTVVLAIFPTLLLILCPDHLWYFLTHPQEAGRTRIRFGLSYAPEVVADKGLASLQAQWGPYYSQINGEDKAIVEGVQRAARSPLAKPGRLSYLEQFTVDLSRYLARRLLAS